MKEKNQLPKPSAAGLCRASGAREGFVTNDWETSVRRWNLGMAANTRPAGPRDSIAVDSVVADAHVAGCGAPRTGWWGWDTWVGASDCS